MIEEIPYEGLDPAPEIELLIFPYTAITQSSEDWYAYFLIYPVMDKWAINSTELCKGPPPTQPGMGGADGTGPLMANLPVEAAPDFLYPRLSSRHAGHCGRPAGDGRWIAGRTNVPGPEPHAGPLGDAHPPR